MNKPMVKKHREPLIHIVKRDDMAPATAWLVRLITIVVGFFLAVGIFMLLSGESFSYIIEYISKTVFGGRTSLGLPNQLWRFLHRTAILLLLALAVTPAFKMKFWNCGAEGQALAGGLAAMICMIELGDKLPAALYLLILVLASVLAGAVWGLIPAIFQAKYKTNETLFTLMMNYIATQIVAYYVYIKGHAGTIRAFPHGNLPTLANQEQLLNILVAVVIMVVMFIYLRYSKHGYEITVVGESQNTARYVGINVKKVILRTMLVSGAVCGIAGMLLVAGKDHSINTHTVGGQGFTAIMVSWLGKFNPFIMAGMAALVIFLETGLGNVADAVQLNKSYADIATGIVVLLLVGCEFFIHYSVKLRHKKEASV